MATADEVRKLLSQVAKDLKPWKESGITLEMVERAYCSVDGGEGMRIQVPFILLSLLLLDENGLQDSCEVP